MTRTRWWHLSVVVTAMVLAVLLFIDDLTTANRAGGLVAIAVFVIGWVLFAPRAPTSAVAAASLAVTVVVACGAGVAFDPNFAIVQSVAFPILWTTWRSVRPALVANIALAVSVGVGFLVSLGTGEAAVAQTIFTVAISLGFSIALGLWFSRVYDLSRERQMLIDELRAAQEQVAALSRDAGAIEERERLARELHDTIAQDLTGLVLTAQRGRRELRSGNVPAAVEQFSILEDNARSALSETRSLVASGAPIEVEGGLTTALNRLGERFERETGVSVTVRAPGTSGLDRDSEVVLLRCAQEALANIRKHASATAASLTVTTTYDAVILRVADNGVGFDAGVPGTGYGLRGMRDRLALAQGTLTILTSPGQGASLVASLPSSRQQGAGQQKSGQHSVGQHSDIHHSDIQQNGAPRDKEKRDGTPPDGNQPEPRPSTRPATT